MAKISFALSLGSISQRPAFTEASKEELRVLIALIESNGIDDSEEALAKRAGTSKARCVGALAFWEEAEVIARKSDGEPTLTHEFETRLRIGEIDEESSLSVAGSIRDENLRMTFDECASLMNLPALSNTEIKNITALNTQYSLSPEFIVTLAAHIAGRGKLTARRLCNEAIKLAGSGCDTVEALERYIENRESESDTDWEFRRILGIYNRNLSQSEKKYFKKWSEEFGYSVTVVSEAYDIAVLNTSKGDLRYMDTILTKWHNAGCKTVEECRAQSEGERAAKAEPAANTKCKAKSAPPTPRYGDFDIKDAFKRALERSYGADSEYDDD